MNVKQLNTVCFGIFLEILLTFTWFEGAKTLFERANQNLNFDTFSFRFNILNQVGCLMKWRGVFNNLFLNTEFLWVGSELHLIKLVQEKTFLFALRCFNVILLFLFKKNAFSYHVVYNQHRLKTEYNYKYNMNKLNNTWEQWYYCKKINNTK